MYAKFGKRLCDLALTLPGLLLLAPFMAIIALLVRFKLGAPVLFCQQRPGLHGRPFTLYKFRTMTDARDAERLTPFGRFLRSTSLDELPELFNVLKGDMSLVGPRPLLMEYLLCYTPEQQCRHEVRPGLTGWAQACPERGRRINGRNALSWEEKFELDVWYVEHLSFWLDLKILWRTLIKVLRREGISSEGHATASKFMGSPYV